MTRPAAWHRRITLMADTHDTDPGFRVTIKDVYNAVERLTEKVDGRLSKLEAQVAAQWVVVGIVVVGLGALLARTLTA